MDDDAEREARRAWFRQTVLPLEPRLHGLAARAGRVAGFDPEDLVQDVLVRMMDHPGWREVRQPLAFMARMKRNLVYDHLRRAKVVAVDAMADLGVLDISDDTPLPDRIFAAKGELARLMAIVDDLPRQCRAAFLLRRVQGFSVAEVADRLGISVSTTEKHLVKGLRLCTERLARDQEQDDEDRTWPRQTPSGSGRMGGAARRGRRPG